MRKPNPEVLAALRKRFPQMTDDKDVVVFDDDHQCYNRPCYTVAFSTPQSNMACTLTLNPAKLKDCRTRHQ
jgi:hypothetical protein